MNENQPEQLSVEHERKSEQMDESVVERAREIERRKQFLEKVMEQVGGDRKQRPLRVQAVIERLSFKEEMITGAVQDLDDEAIDSATRSKRILQWIESGVQNWRRSLENDSARTGLEDDVFEQVANYICAYIQGKGKKQLFRLLLEISRFSRPESAAFKSRCRQLIMNDAIMGFPLGRGAHKEPLLPLDSNRIDPSKLFLRGWKRGLRRMLLGSVPKKDAKVQFTSPGRY